MNKKLIALVLAFALVFSSFSAAFADTAISADAQAAKDLGMLVGSGNGVTSQYLLENPTRLQTALMFLRLKGLEGAALSFNGTSNFADANEIKWAEGRNVLAYLKAHPELGWAGVGNNEFNPNEIINAQSYYKVMLEAIGYKANTTEVIGDFTWNNVFTFAASKGLVKVANVSVFTVNDLATATIEALKATVNGSTKTLAVSLVDAKVITEAAAIAAGVYTKAPVALAVASVTAVNNKQIVVVFNKDVDSTTAQDEANYEIKDNGTVVKALGATSAVLQADKKTVVITLDAVAALTNSTNAKVTVTKAVKDAAGVAMAADFVNSTVRVYDGVAPVVEKVEAIGPKTLKVTFSEPIFDGTDAVLNTANFAVKSGTYNYVVNSATSDFANKTVEVTVGTNLIPGEITVTMNNAGSADVDAIRDFAGIRAFKADTKFVFATDATVPTVAVKATTETTVTLKFSKKVSATDLTLYHSVKGVAAYSATSNIVNNDEVTFTFANKMPAGNVALYLVNSTTEANKIADLFGNKVADTTFTAVIVVDTVGAKVVETKLNTNASYDITFDENIDVNEAAKVANFSVKKAADGKDVTFTVAPLNVVNGTTKVVRITPSAVFTDNTSYEVVVKAMKDVAGNAMAATASYTFKVGDNNNPTATAFAVNADGKIYITFSEPMNETQMLDKTNYLVDVDGIGATAIAALGTNDTVTKLSEKSVLIDMAVAVSTPDVKFATMTDLAGKKLGSDTTIGYTVAAIAPETVNVASATLIAKNKIKLTFNKELASFDNTEFTLVNAADDSAFVTALQVSQVESLTVNADGVTEVVLVLDKNINTNATYTDVTAKAVKVIAVSPINTKAKTGTVLSGTANAVVADKVVAELETVTVNGVKVADVTLNAGKVAINFTENMNLASMSTLSFSVAGYTVTSVALNADNSIVELTVTANSASSSTTPAVTLNYNIQDANSNIFAAGATWTVR